MLPCHAHSVYREVLLTIKAEEEDYASYLMQLLQLFPGNVEPTSIKVSTKVKLSVGPIFIFFLKIKLTKQ